MTDEDVSAPVRKNGPSSEWEHRELYDRVRDAIYALPGLFESPLQIEGVRATDLFTLNSTLAASIEQSVVDNLNRLRRIWDPDEEYSAYSFRRQTQVFPDVRLQTDSPNINPKILLGIELKGWFALSKEGEPSFRYTVSPRACADADLLVIFPWILDEVTSGTPFLMKPFVDEAKFAAEHRNYYWQTLRGRTGEHAKIDFAPNPTPYPNKNQKFNDKAVKDSGKNFGRVARGQYMTKFIEELMSYPVSGIPLQAWHRFISIFTGAVTKTEISTALDDIESAMAPELAGNETKREKFSKIRDAILDFYNHD